MALKETLSEAGTSSAMRWGLIGVVLMAAVLVAAVAAAIIIQTVKADVDVNWPGIATVVGAIGVFLAPAFGFKAYQKKLEK